MFDQIFQELSNIPKATVAIYHWNFQHDPACEASLKIDTKAVKINLQADGDTPTEAITRLRDLVMEGAFSGLSVLKPLQLEALPEDTPLVNRPTSSDDMPF